MFVLLVVILWILLVAFSSPMMMNLVQNLGNGRMVGALSSLNLDRSLGIGKTGILVVVISSMNLLVLSLGIGKVGVSNHVRKNLGIWKIGKLVVVISSMNLVQVNHGIGRRDGIEKVDVVNPVRKNLGIERIGKVGVAISSMNLVLMVEYVN